MAEGARVTICDIDRGRVEAAAERLGGGADRVVADLTDPDDSERFVLDASRPGRRRHPGRQRPGTAAGHLGRGRAEDYPRALDLNLLAVVRMCQAAVPAMRERRWGRVVAITSIAVRQPYPNLVLRNTARAGATGFLRTLAREVAADGVTVNSVLPGLHETERVEWSMPRGWPPRSRRPGAGARQPAEFGAAVAFLCSQQART